MKKICGPIGISCEPLKQKYDKDVSFGAYLSFDRHIKIGLVIYFYKWALGLWLL